MLGFKVSLMLNQVKICWEIKVFYVNVAVIRFSLKDQVKVGWELGIHLYDKKKNVENKFFIR